MKALVVGSGFVGRAIARHLLDHGDEAVLASRTPPFADGAPVTPDWVPLDVAVPGAFAETLHRTAADTVVLVHGPSDVTWCESHPEEAMAGHAGAARMVAEAAGDRRVVFISTDNVFDGTAVTSSESTPTHPANAYGRAKRAAEDVLSALPGAVLLRVSLIYGWETADTPKWLNFFASCVHRLRAGETVAAPYDQWTTPVLIDDVAEATRALVTTATAPKLLHLGGPDRISRADWAAGIAAALGVPRERVTAEPRAHGRYAHRPASTCLSSELFATHPATAALRPRPVQEATRLLLGRHLPPTVRSTA
ncbi:SDR family oxidoreductase [Streptomyces olivaceus]|uniref:SDR family oxidoreductase n=1 Tax=Streptomyces TaxID=1883 RepID=UPI001FB756A4|nr:sugar nucleotide-binding protein [Streptomyces sp. CB09030]UOG81647.1 sugar nucleotide-binding protein [Streptomyces sp. CB09030]